MPSHAKRYITFVGSYASADEPGIHIFNLDAEDRSLSRLTEASGMENPSFVVVDAPLSRLFAVSEAFSAPGSVNVYSLDPASNRLTKVGSAPTHGTLPCNIGYLPHHRVLVTVNYMGGNVLSYRVDDDGRLSSAVSNLAHQGAGPNPDRQDRPHPHAAVFDPTGQYVMVPDLGTDSIVVYRCNAEDGSLSLLREVKTDPGSGPRLMVFHPNGHNAYVIHELANTVVAYHYSSTTGELQPIQTVSTIPTTWEGSGIAAHIALSTSGRHLYASNRGHNSIAVFDVDGTDGRLTSRGHVSTNGATPRHFAITPDGHTMIVGNQDSDQISLFAVDPETGDLQFTGKTVSVKKPTCVAYLPV